MAKRRSYAVLLALVTVLGVAFGFASRAANEEKGILSEFISRSLSTPASRVSIGDIEGALSSNAVIRDIQVADRDGVWLRLDRVRIVWRRLALLQRRLEIDTLEAAQLEIVRRPVPAETPVAGESQPLLPELPLKVEIKNFSLQELKLGEPLLGTAARLSAAGAARLGPPAEGLDFRLDLRRLDQAGALTASLGFVPASERLTLALALDEPQSGILARAAAIPGLPPVKLDLRGQGTLDAFQANLAFAAGAEIGANGTATLRRETVARRLGLDLAANIAGLMPSVVAPVFSGTTRLTGNVSFADDGSVAVPGLSVLASAARLDATGTVSPDRIADLRVVATNVPTGENRTEIAGTEVRRLAFDGRVTGALTTPTIDASLQAEDARLPAGGLQRLEATFRAVPAGTSADGRTPIELTGDARATGLTLTDPALAKAVGNEATLRLRGTTNGDGGVSFEALELVSPTIKGRFAGRAASSQVNGRVVIDAPDLARFGDVAGLALRGTATVSGDLEGTPRANRYGLRLDARATGFGTGIAPADGLFGGKLEVKGGVRLEADGTIGFDSLEAVGQHANLRLDGAAAPAAADVRATLAVPNLARADRRLTGRGDVDAHVTGTLERPDARATIAVSDASALGRPVPRLALEVTARDIRGALDARVTLDGEIDRKPARGSVRILRPSEGGTSVQGIDVVIGSVSLTGDVALAADNLASGRVTLKARNLDDVSPLLLNRVSGEIDADVSLTATGGAQAVEIDAQAQRLAGYGIAIGRLGADVTLTDVYRHPVVSGTVTVDRADIAGEEISQIRVTAQGTPQASDLVLTASARGLSADARARVVPGDQTRIELQRLNASRGSQRIALAGPATLTLTQDGVDIADVALALGGGRLTLSGRAGSSLDLRVDARAIPLSAAEIVVPGLGLSGTLDGSTRLTGSAAAPSGNYQLRVAKLNAPQIRAAGLSPVDASATGALNGSRATVDATISLAASRAIRIGGSVPLGDAGDLDLSVRGTLDAGLANRSLAVGGRRVTGSVAVDARIGGSLDEPQVSGAATLSGGSYSDATLGVQLNDLRARFVARGRDVSIESASGTTKNGGQVRAAGRVALDPAEGFPGSIRVTGQRAQLIQTAYATAVLNLDVALAGPLARAPRIGGRVDVVSLDVTLPERLPATLQPLPGTKHVRPTRTAAARLALDTRSKRTGRATPAFDAALDLTIAALGNINVSGRGLNAELGGNLRLTGTLAKPDAVGAFSLRQGRLQILTSRLDITRGNLTFAGDLSPELDFQATTRSGGATVAVNITGPASDPQFAFTSSPDLPQDEVLSRLLFGTPSGQLSAGQALALAQAAAQYSSGGGAFEGLRRSLGLSGVDINLGATGGPVIGLSRELNSRVSVGVKAGAGAGQTAVGVDVNLSRGFKLQAEAGAQGAVSVGIGAEREW